MNFPTQSGLKYLKKVKVFAKKKLLFDPGKEQYQPHILNLDFKRDPTLYIQLAVGERNPWEKAGFKLGMNKEDMKVPDESELMFPVFPLGFHCLMLSVHVESLN